MTWNESVSPSPGDVVRVTLPVHRFRRAWRLRRLLGLRYVDVVGSRQRAYRCMSTGTTASTEPSWPVAAH